MIEMLKRSPIPVPIQLTFGYLGRVNQGRCCLGGQLAIKDLPLLRRVDFVLATQI